MRIRTYIPCLKESFKTYQSRRKIPLKETGLTEEQFFQTKEDMDWSESFSDYLSFVGEEAGIPIKDNVSDVDIITYVHSHLNMDFDKKKKFVDDIVPGPSMLASLGCDMLTGDSWLGISKDWLEMCLTGENREVPQVRRIDVRKHDFRHTALLNQYLNDRIESAKKTFSSGSIQFNMLYTCVIEKDYQQMLKDRADGKTASVQIYNAMNFPKNETLRRLPIMILLSCGGDDLMIIDLGFYEQDVNLTKFPDKLWIDPDTTMTEDLVKFLDNLPLMYALDANAKTLDLELFLADVYGCYVRFRVFNLKFLALATGCKMNKMDIHSLCAVVLGRPMLYTIETLSRCFVRSNEEVCEEVDDYISELVLSIHMLYVVLMATFLRNVFPDPSVVLTYSQMNQASFTNWFAHVTGTALLDGRFNTWRHHTRRDMIANLNSNSQRLKKIAALIERVPVPKHGGARFLHHARHCFARQLTILETIETEGFNGIVPSFGTLAKPTSYDLLYEREYLVDDSWKPVRSTGLCVSPQFRHTMFEIDVGGDICHFEQQHGRHLIPSLEEWARLFPEAARNLLMKLADKDSTDLQKFWFAKPRAYVKIRAVVHHVLDMERSVPLIEESMRTHRNNSLQFQRSIQERRSNRYPREVIEDDSRREVLMEHMVASEPLSVDLQGRGYKAIPSHFTERNRRFRTRQFSAPDMRSHSRVQSDERQGRDRRRYFSAPDQSSQRLRSRSRDRTRHNSGGRVRFQERDLRDVLNNRHQKHRSYSSHH